MGASSAAASVFQVESQTAPLVPLTRLLDDLTTVLLQISSEAYVAKPLSAVSGSIGQHVRHILDHIGAFVRVSRSATLSYDTRERGTAVERDSAAAISVILGLKMMVAQRSDLALNTAVDVEFQISRREFVTGHSSIGRELAFVVSHTIHHQAIIAMLLALQGYAAPDEFGLAPSTPRFGNA